jgi:hypothetical protein
MLTFFKIILIIFLVLTILGYVSRFLLKIFLIRLAKKMNPTENDKGQRVGDTYIKDTPTKEKVVNKNIGDYVDFEEIKTK